MTRFAVIPTHNRPHDYADCLAAIAPQVDEVIIVAHDAPYVRTRDGVVLDYEAEVPNISRMWNMGLYAAESLAEGRPYHVAVINDDVIVPPDWFDRVVSAMGDKAAGCVQREFDPRMTGYAFILNGTIRLFADEQFQWWYGDDDLQRRAEKAGGVAYAPGQDVEHRHPNSTTVGILADIAREDGYRFNRKWKRGHLVR